MCLARINGQVQMNLTEQIHQICHFQDTSSSCCVYHKHCPHACSPSDVAQVPSTSWAAHGQVFLCRKHARLIFVIKCSSNSLFILLHAPCQFNTSLHSCTWNLNIKINSFFCQDCCHYFVQPGHTEIKQSMNANLFQRPTRLNSVDL